ncbi:hypothetical protein NCCP133_22160 [Cytobacillus sp. NCCP-133]|nr:hypothetical protein NCCP133_22160 [Cytobacillus sp. NCCP-133]
MALGHLFLYDYKAGKLLMVRIKVAKKRSGSRKTSQGKKKGRHEAFRKPENHSWEEKRSS